MIRLLTPNTQQHKAEPASGPRASSPHDERDDKENEEDEKQNLGDPSRLTGNPAKSKYGSHNGNDQEYRSPTKHDNLLEK